MQAELVSTDCGGAAEPLTVVVDSRLSEVREKQVELTNPYPLTLSSNASNNYQRCEDQVQDNCSQDTRQQAVETTRLLEIIFRGIKASKHFSYLGLPRV